MTLVCLACRVPDPPPEMTCTLRRDHRVDLASGCPDCGRLAAALYPPPVRGEAPLSPMAAPEKVSGGILRYLSFHHRSSSGAANVLLKPLI